MFLHRECHIRVRPAVVQQRIIKHFLVNASPRPHPVDHLVLLHSETQHLLFVRLVVPDRLLFLKERLLQLSSDLEHIQCLLLAESRLLSLVTTFHPEAALLRGHDQLLRVWLTV